MAVRAAGRCCVADGSLLAADFRAGQPPAGAQGPQGVAGPRGSSGATSVVVRAASGTGTVKIDCAAAERATGGGAHSAFGRVQGSAPVVDPLAFFSTTTPSRGYAPTSWSARGQDAGGADADITVWVVCAAP